MTRPPQPWETMPPWNTRLLEKIQDLSVDHTQVLQRGYPTYNLAFGGAEVQMQTWRTHLRALEADRSEVEVHARAAGIPQEMIADARTLGSRGVRWNERQPPPPTGDRGQDAVREMMVEGVAADVWQLEHMAAISATHRHRLAAQGIHSEAHPIAASQLQSNMIALWLRASEVARVVGLTAEERDQLWGRDAEGWQRLMQATVHTYDDPALEERWRVFAWPGIEHDAQQTVETLNPGKDSSTSAAAEQTPPLPHLMIQQAEEALENPGAPAEAGTEQIGAAVDAALPLGTAHSWGSEPVGETDPAVPSPVRDDGLEL
ncbi:hypothetical protein ACQPW1_22450 [Nocardia sp. CA-128927]|uniref:hypothetical protein n=1 Tax=Nocardia sp. CA-128927 TaxID=3239975 RepID=UPI003D9545D2